MIKIEKISGLDHRLMQKAQTRLDNLTKPQGSLGKLEDLAKLVVGITAKDNPRIENKVIFTFAADHGVVEDGVSAYPKEVTAQMVYNFLHSGAGINVLAKHIGARVVVADLGVCVDLAKKEGLFIKKVGYGTNNFRYGPAMTMKEAEESINNGITIFGSEYKKGIDIVGLGEMGIGNTTAASAITAVFTGLSVESVTGRGTGIDDGGLRNKIKVIEEAIKLNRPDPNNPLDVLAKVGGFEIGGLAGVVLAAAEKRVPVVVDGFISAAASLIACGIAPETKNYLIPSHCSVEKGHRALLDYLGIEPLFDLKLRLGEGTGAALGINIVEASVKILTEMATFKEAGVSEKG